MSWRQNFGKYGQPNATEIISKGRIYKKQRWATPNDSCALSSPITTPATYYRTYLMSWCCYLNDHSLPSLAQLCGAGEHTEKWHMPNWVCSCKLSTILGEGGLFPEIAANISGGIFGRVHGEAGLPFVAEKLCRCHPLPATPTPNKVIIKLCLAAGGCHFSPQNTPELCWIWGILGKTCQLQTGSFWEELHHCLHFTV